MDIKGSSRGQIGLVVNIFLAGFVGMLLAIIVQIMWTNSRGNFTGLALNVGDFFVPIFMVLLICVPVMGVVFMFGRGR